MPGIVDAHVHMYPPEVAADPSGWARRMCEPGWSACVAPAGRASIQGWADVPRLLSDMDRAGIETCIMLGWYWERQESCDLQNQWYAGLIREHPGRLRGFAAVQPGAGQAAIDGLMRALDAGLCGVGEVLPQAQGFDFEDPVWRRVVGIASDRGVPITLHATDPGSPPAAGPRTPLEGFLRLAAEFPRARFIVAHWGGGLALGGSGSARWHLPPNLFFDTAASPLLYDREVFRRAIDRVGAGRILYGSDYPLRLYPRTERETDFRPFLAEIAGAGLTPGELEGILGGNARELLSGGSVAGS